MWDVLREANVLNLARGATAMFSKKMFKCTCGLCLRALVNQWKMSHSKSQFSACMKWKNLVLDETMKVN